MTGVEVKVRLSTPKRSGWESAACAVGRGFKGDRGWETTAALWDRWTLDRARPSAECVLMGKGPPWLWTGDVGGGGMRGTHSGGGRSQACCSPEVRPALVSFIHVTNMNPGAAACSKNSLKHRGWINETHSPSGEFRNVSNQCFFSSERLSHVMPANLFICYYLRFAFVYPCRHIPRKISAAFRW